MHRDRPGSVGRAIGIARAVPLSALILLFAQADAQLSVSPQANLQQLASAITGQGVVISNPSVTCHSAGYGVFSYTGAALDVDHGVILTSGSINDALGPNNVNNKTFQAGTSGNSMLDIVTGRTTMDACTFEFDIIPAGDTLHFDFVFGSEEYNEWVGSQYNDVFGFFINGPGITGDPGIAPAHNIARVPGTNTAVTINNINNGSNSSYYTDNTGGSVTQYDGFTTGLSARSPVIPCQTYHLKLVVADASDRKFDSGVLINRLESNPVSMTSHTLSSGPSLVEACNPGWVRFTRTNVTSSPLNLQYYLNGSATNGTDYTAIGNVDPAVPKTITIPANQAYVDRQIDPLSDLLPEGAEFLRFILGNPSCPQVPIDSLILPINDSLVATVQPLSATICSSGSVPLQVVGGTGYSWSPATGLSCTNCAAPIASPTTTTTYSVTITEGACARTMNRQIRVSDLALSGVVVHPLCNGASNGAINLSHTGGIAPYTYSWTGPNGFTANSQDVTGLIAGSYTVVVNDAGCSRSMGFNLIAPAVLNVALAPSVLAFGQNISCSGGHDGSIDATINGGTGPYAVNWAGPNGFASNATDLSNLYAGTYTMAVADVNGCLASTNITLAAAAPVSAAVISTTHSLCFGDGLGSATVQGSGGAPPYSYQWDTTPTQNTAMATGLPVGNSTATVTDAYGCTAATNVTITGPAQPLATTITALSHVLCYGTPTGSVTLNATGGTAPYIYSWNTTPQQNTATAGDLPPGSWTCTVTDDHGCMTTRIVDIGQPASPLSASLFALTDVHCSGNSSGAATVIANGGQGPYTFEWNTVPAQHTATATALPAGSYTCTVRDANNCSVQVTATIAQPDPLTSSISARTDVSCHGGNTGSVTVAATGGTTPYHPVWNTSPVQTTLTAVDLSAGAYTCTITDANGCMTTSSSTITQPAAPLSTVTSATNVQCHGESTGDATVDASGGTAPYVFSWNTSPTQASGTAAGLPAGTWTCTITDDHGCSAAAAVTIMEPSSSPIATLAGQTNVDCFGAATGSAGVMATGGTGPYTFLWNTLPSQDNATATGLVAGDHVCTVEDANGCTATITATITQPAEVLQLGLSSQTNVLCAGNSTGSATMTALGGTAPYSYAWNTLPVQEGPTASGLAAGTYGCTVIDALHCSATATVAISEPAAPLDATATIFSALCQGLANGTIDATISGGTGTVALTWSGPNGFTSSNEDLSGLSAGVYILHLTDANGCEDISYHNVLEPSTYTITSTISTYNGGVNTSCNGVNDGSIDLSIAGATPPYSILWNGPGGYSSTDEDISGLIAGTYVAIVSDANDCATSMAHELVAPATLGIALSASVFTNGNNISCNGASDGSIGTTYGGGTAPMQFAWSGPNSYASSDEDITGLGIGTYQLVLTDANGCTATDGTTLIAPDPLEATVYLSQYPSGSAISCAGSNDGAIKLVMSGGAAPYSATWSGPSGPIGSGLVVSGLSPGDYVASVMDVNGCTLDTTITLIAPEPLGISSVMSSFVGGVGVTCYGATDGSISITANGGAGNTLFHWTGSGAFTSSNEDLIGLPAGTYVLQATDMNGCSAQGNFTLGAPAPISASVVMTAATCQGNGDGSIDLTSIGGTEPHSYLWSGPSAFSSSSEDIDNIGAGTYSVTITDANGCQLVQAFDPGQPMPFTISASITTYPGGFNTSCPDAQDGAIDLSPDGGTSPYHFTWTGPDGFSATTEDISSLGTGMYDLNVTDQNGCGMTASYTILSASPITMDLQPTVYPGGANISCSGLADGSIDATISGGIPPYVIMWSGPNGVSTSEDISALEAGDYTLIVIDAVGCYGKSDITLVAPAPLQTAITSSIYGNGTGVSCASATDGSIDLLVTGGSSPYLTAWTGPDGFASPTEDLSGLAAGTYEVVVSDINGCPIASSTTLTAPPAIVVELDPSLYSGGYNIPCSGDALGSILANASGGTGDLTFAWTGSGGPIGTDAAIVGLSAGEYDLTVTDDPGCTTLASITLLAPPALTITSVLSDAGHGYQVSCNAQDGSITLTAAGGTAPIQFDWTGPDGFASQNEDIMPLAAGEYQLEVTDANGCAFNDTLSLTAPVPLDGTLLVGAPICAGTNDGTIDLNLVGGTQPYTFSWNGPGTTNVGTEDLSGLGAGVYTVNVNDAGTCSGSWTATVESIGAMTADIYRSTYGAVNIACTGDSAGVLEATIAGGQGPLTFSWTGTTGFTSNESHLHGLIAGDYLLTVTDVNGCSLDSTITLTEPATALSSSLSAALFPSGTNIACFGGANGSIDLTPIGGAAPYTFDWRGPDSTSFATEDLSGLVAGAYELVITDDNQCVHSTSITLTQPDSVVMAIALSQYSGFNTTCTSTSDGSISVTLSGGSPDHTLTWSGPNGFSGAGDTLTDLVAGTYELTATDINGCTVIETVTLVAPEPLSWELVASTFPSGTNISCHGLADGSITSTIMGGSGGYGTQWTGPDGFTAATATLDALTAGEYCLTITDLNDCVATDCITLSEPQPLSVIATPTSASCGQSNGGVDGAVSGGSGPYTYSWSNGDPTEDLEAVPSDTYTLNVTDANGCSASAQAQVVGASALLGDAMITDVPCNGGNEGIIDLTMTSGTAPFAFSWTGGIHTEDLQGLPAGSYQVQVTDAAGCTWSSIQTVDQPAPIGADSTVLLYDNGFHVSALGASDGSVAVAGTGGTSPYTYVWSNGATGPAVEGLSAGAYSVTITDANGCSRVFFFSLTEPNDLELPTGFTPNGDGQNDLYVVRGLDNWPHNELVVFNRWGNVVYQRINYSNDWAGENTQGGALPNGTYFIILRLTGGPTFQNYVDLRR